MAEIAEELVNGYVYQSDRQGIMTAWDVDDHQSGLVSYHLAVGTTPGHILTLFYFILAGFQFCKYW